MMLKPWREIAIPHEDVLKGTFQQAEFAADLSSVHDGTAMAGYQDAALFFERTYITEGMRLLLDSVVRRLSGQGGDPVIQLQTAFGGGKTHTMLAVYHLASGRVPFSELSGVPPILDVAGITEMPKARVAVLDGIKLLTLASQPRRRGGVEVHTIWGELAWQLAGDVGYALLEGSDKAGTAPGKDVMTELLKLASPCVILIDELVAYIRQFEGTRSYSGGTFDSNLSFIQSLTEGIKVVPTAILLASLPESEKEAGSVHGVKALDALSHYFGRVQALWKPVGAEEAFEIVRRRLFNPVTDTLASAEVCRSFADYYTDNASDFPNETADGRYHDRLKRAYPIHPEVFDRLYEDWSSLDNFQRTRGVLKLMAKVIHRLWKDGNNEPLIMPGSLPLYDADVSNEAINYLPQGWDPVLARDIDGERSETAMIESRDTRFGSLQACRRTARAVFLGSAPTTANQMVRGIEAERIMLGVAVPGQQTGVYKDALNRLGERLHYLNNGNNRFWFDTKPNLRREMEERKRRFQDREDVFPVIRERVRQTMNVSLFDAIHTFCSSGDVPDDNSLRLVILPPDAAYSSSGQNLALDKALEILKNRGDQPRQRQNRLIFLAAEYECVSRLKDQVRSMLAWQSIVRDIEELKLNLDQHQSIQARRALDDASEALKRMVREAYKWLLAPYQSPDKGLTNIEWEASSINPSAASVSQAIEAVLRDQEIVISEWAPIHLSNILKRWFWKNNSQDVVAQDVWQAFCCYLYLPRLKTSEVFSATIRAGVPHRDFFGVAQGKDGDRYVGFVYDEAAQIFMDSTMLLIDPITAAAFKERLMAEAAAAAAPTIASPQANPPQTGTSMPAGDSGGPAYGGSPAPISLSKQHFYGTVELDPVAAKIQFVKIIDEVLLQFTLKPDAKVTLKLDIEADSPAGFDDALQRAVKENCTTLKFDDFEFS